jgi:HSP20 family molecular chaperone IbpA
MTSNPTSRFAHLARAQSELRFLVPSLTTSWLGFSQRDEPDAVTFELRTPGYRRRDLAIEVRDRAITVRGDRTDGWLKPRSKKSFVHTFNLPEALDEQDVSASFARGTLQLKVAKKPSARRRQIRVEAPGAAQRPVVPRTEVEPWSRLRGWLRDVCGGRSAVPPFDAAG